MQQGIKLKLIEFNLNGDVAIVRPESLTVMGLHMVTLPFFKIKWSSTFAIEKLNILNQAFKECKTNLPVPKNPNEFSNSLLKEIGLKSYKEFYKGGYHCSIKFDSEANTYQFTPMIF